MASDATMDRRTGGIAPKGLAPSNPQGPHARIAKARNLRIPGVFASAAFEGKKPKEIKGPLACMGLIRKKRWNPARRRRANSKDFKGLAPAYGGVWRKRRLFPETGSNPPVRREPFALRMSRTLLMAKAKSAMWRGQGDKFGINRAATTIGKSCGPRSCARA
jgi:hypothetical protein